MGKYLPVIKTTECKSLTKAGQVLGYTQPSLGYIINNIEDELGCKIFYRDQRGVTLTEIGAKLLEPMKQVEELEEKIRQLAKTQQEALLRVGIFPSVATQWVPRILEEFYKIYPQTMVKLEHQLNYLHGEMGVREHRLDCCFFTGTCPRGMEAVPLYDDPYYLVVSQEDPMAKQSVVSVEELRERVFIPTNESWDECSALWDVYRSLGKNSRMDYSPQENSTCVALVEQGLGISILSQLDLTDILPWRRVCAIPLKEGYARRISLLCPHEAKRSSLTGTFLTITQHTVADWELEQKQEQ